MLMTSSSIKEASRFEKLGIILRRQRVWHDREQWICTLGCLLAVSTTFSTSDTIGKTFTSEQYKMLPITPLTVDFQIQCIFTCSIDHTVLDLQVAFTASVLKGDK